MTPEGLPDSLTLRIAGDGGEGVLRCGELLADLLAEEHHHVLMHRGALRMVGAPASVELRFGDSPMRALTGSLDILFAWSQDAYDRHRDALFPEGVLLYDVDRVRPREADAPIRHALPLSRMAASAAYAELERPKAYVAAGVLARLLGARADVGGFVERADGPIAAAAFEEGAARSRLSTLGVLRFEVGRARAWPGALVTGARLVAESLAASGARFVASAGATRDLPLVVALEEAGLTVSEEEDAERAIIAARAFAQDGRRAIVLSPEGLHGLGSLWHRVGDAPVLLVCAPREESASDPGDLCALSGVRSQSVVAPGTIDECGAAATFAARSTFEGRATTLYVDPLLEDCAESLPAEIRSAAEDEQRFERGPSFDGDNPEATVGVISWGAMRGPVDEAVLECRARGLRVRHVHVRRLLPLDEDAWRAFLAPLERVVVAEPEPSDPVAMLLEQRFGISPERIWWPAAVPLSPTAVVDALMAGT